MPANWRALSALIGGALGLILSAATLYLRWSGQLGAPQNVTDLANNIAYVLLGASLTLAGAFLSLRRPDNLVCWLTLAGGVAVALDNYVQLFPDFWVNGWAWLLPYTVLALLLLYYPTGRLLSSRWRWVPRTITLIFLAFIVWLGYRDIVGAGDYRFLEVSGPFGVQPFWIYLLGGVAIMLAVSLLALGLRFSRVRGAERQQIKWVLLAGALLVITFIINQLIQSQLSLLLDNLAALCIPIVIAIAILRYRLFDIDVIIRRTTSYAVITATLALIYFTSIVILQQLLSPFTGESTPSLVLSTLLIAALFLPIRRRVQNTVDSRFNRTRYDAEKTIEAFAATVRNETDLDALTAELLRVIQDTMQPASLSISLRKPDISSANVDLLDEQSTVAGGRTRKRDALYDR